MNYHKFAWESWRYPYWGYEDFVLRHGRVFQPRSLPKGIKAGRPRQCFKNAAILVDENPGQFTYVEGYAWSSANETMHAWVVDSNGDVIDPTWTGKRVALELIGVPFTANFLLKRICARGYYGIFGGLYHECPLITGEIEADAVIADIGNSSFESEDTSSRHTVAPHNG